jgi:hypothetical protein
MYCHGGGQAKVFSSLQIENSQILGLIRIEKFLGWANQQIANLQSATFAEGL